MNVYEITFVSGLTRLEFAHSYEHRHGEHYFQWHRGFTTFNCAYYDYNIKSVKLIETIVFV